MYKDQFTREQGRMARLVSTISKFLAAGLGCLALFGCRANWNEPVDRSEFVKCAQPGTGVIEGQAFGRSVDGTVHFVEEETVTLRPATTYFLEWYERDLLGNERLKKPDAYAASFIRSATTDEAGGFKLEHLPAGEYIIAIIYNPSSYLSRSTVGNQLVTEQAAYARVGLSEGEAKRVDLDRWTIRETQTLME